MPGIDDAHNVGSGARGRASSSHEGSSPPSSARSFSEREDEEDAVRAFTSVRAAEPEDKKPRGQPDRRTSNAGQTSNSNNRSRIGLHNVKPQEEIRQGITTTNSSMYTSPGARGGDDGGRIQRSEGGKYETGSNGGTSTTIKKGKPARRDSEQLGEGRTRK